MCLGDEWLFVVGIKVFIDNMYELYLDKKGGYWVKWCLLIIIIVFINFYGI